MSDEKKVVNNTAEALEAEISMKSNKTSKEKKTGKGGKKVSEFFKGLRSDIKKINWPTFKMVLKSTGVVLFVVAFLGVIIFGIDQGMAFLIGKLNDIIGLIVKKIGNSEASTAANIASMLMM